MIKIFLKENYQIQFPLNNFLTLHKIHLNIVDKKNNNKSKILIEVAKQNKLGKIRKKETCSSQFSKKV